MASNSNSRSMYGSQSIYPGGSGSRPFLNMLNPMGRTYQGYMQANQSVVEEEDEENPDLEAGQTSRGSVHHSSSRAHGKRKVTWGGEASEMNVLRPNNRQADPKGEESSDDEVPQDFMIEASAPAQRRPPSPPPTKSAKGKERQERKHSLHSLHSSRRPSTSKPILPITSTDTPLSIPPRPSEIGAELRSQSEPLHEPQPKHMRGLDEHERALWNWVNVYNLDAFLQEAYYYYEGKGLYSIALSRGLNLLTVGFVIGFSTFLLGCVDYSRIRPDKVTRLSEVVVSRCVSRFSGFTLFFFMLFSAFFIWQLVSYVLSMMRLVDMYRFYTHLLHIPDEDIQTISWPEVVRRIGAIREDNPLTALSSNTAAHQSVTAKLDAHDIANRIMRQENYLIALFNKELLDLRVPLPVFLQRFAFFRTAEEGKGKTLTRALEWNLRFCLMEYLFDESGRVRKVFLKSKNRAVLIEGLRRRLIFMGILNAIFAPFIVLYLIMYSFFRYFEEYHKNPSNIGGRGYTPYAQWKFREFNELPHLFKRRLNESHETASMYIGQFPNEKVTIIARFVAFIAGSFAAVLVLASVLDPDLFLHFEISAHRTVLFYITLFGSVLAVARGMIPEENRVFDPELLMTEVVQYTHYMPDEWKGQLHSKKVHEGFGQLFAMKVVTFAQELLSVILTPFVLWYSLPPCAPAIVDFFREFTVHVDGLGYVCSFAVFDFQRHGNVKFGAPTKAVDERWMSKEGKMEKSFLNFKAAHPDWTPNDPSGSLYLSRMADLSAAHPVGLGRRRLLQRDTPNIAPVQGDMDSTVHLHAPGLAEKARDYDRALRASQSVRRRGPNASMMMGSVLHPAQLGQTGRPGDSMLQSTMGGPAMAQTAVLGDSQGSVMPLGGHTVDSVIPEEDLALDGGVGSTLGESYVDGRRPRPSVGQSQQEEDEEELEDGGVLGLLAQIYGTGANFKGRGRGPPRVL
ncbi:APG9-domain-containing protein [Lentinus tigrinus ALCF2SS1-7]|uniref:Autophagy-related protein 9 n=1 Tax=Lentinus tigrinus ALCF2SS1-6 TaxID=1328759 RepID=A0A5C2SRL5_9APHY|nr:APG9-domain-containing protein [Lentinus tigrinus ALCF2SS1-6]RPD80445.1 APG9-domain-containing protein [Lentinus tigrinus ALCF2SS1-7]